MPYFKELEEGDFFLFERTVVSKLSRDVGRAPKIYKKLKDQPDEKIKEFVGVAIPVLNIDEDGMVEYGENELVSGNPTIIVLNVGLQNSLHKLGIYMVGHNDSNVSECMRDGYSVCKFFEAPSDEEAIEIAKKSKSFRYNAHYGAWLYKVGFRRYIKTGLERGNAE